jgi:hypothetical protein
MAISACPFRIDEILHDPAHCDEFWALENTRAGENWPRAGSALNVMMNILGGKARVTLKALQHTEGRHGRFELSGWAGGELEWKLQDREGKTVIEFLARPVLPEIVDLHGMSVITEETIRQALKAFLWRTKQKAERANSDLVESAL